MKCEIQQVHERLRRFLIGFTLNSCYHVIHSLPHIFFLTTTIRRHLNIIQSVIITSKVFIRQVIELTQKSVPRTFVTAYRKESTVVSGALLEKANRS